MSCAPPVPDQALPGQAAFRVVCCVRRRYCTEMFMPFARDGGEQDEGAGDASWAP